MPQPLKTSLLRPWLQAGDGQRQVHQQDLLQVSRHRWNLQGVSGLDRLQSNHQPRGSGRVGHCDLRPRVDCGERTALSPIKCGDLGNRVSDAAMDLFGRIVLHEMLSVVHPPIPMSRLNWGVADQVIQTPQRHWRLCVRNSHTRDGQ
jgi:hypothetical protein